MENFPLSKFLFWKGRQVLSQRKGTLRVLLVSPLPPPAGGIGTWTEIVLREMKQKPSVILKHISTTQRWKKKMEQSKKIQMIDGSRRAITDIFSVLFLLATFRPHVFHLTTSGGYSSLKDFVMMLLAKLFGVAGLIHYRASRIDGYQKPGKWVFYLAMLAIKVATVVVVLDQGTYDFLMKRIPQKKLKKIPNMIDLDRVDKMIADLNMVSPDHRKNKKARLIFVGRVVSEKGVVEQVEACAQLENVQLHLVGPIEGSFRKQLQNIAQFRDGGNWLQFHGQVDNDEARRQILLGDILLLPSYYEAFPNFVLEGMAHAKPVVVSDAGAMPEMIDAEGENPCGVLVKPRETQSLLLGIKSLLENPEVCRDMGQNGRNRVERIYSCKAVLTRLEEQWWEMKAMNSHGYD